MGRSGPASARPEVAAWRTPPDIPCAPWAGDARNPVLLPLTHCEFETDQIARMDKVVLTQQGT
jgi:hypothetical protein